MLIRRFRKNMLKVGYTCVFKNDPDCEFAVTKLTEDRLVTGISKDGVVYKVSADEVVPTGKRVPSWGMWFDNKEGETE